jgi:asparagine synthase (glutamine-hydrolysing)
MLRRMAHFDWHQPVRAENTGERAALGAIVLDQATTAVAEDAGRQLTLVLAGELFGTDPERQRLSAAGEAVASDAALILAGWRLEGAAFLARLNGEFVATVWDAARGELHLISDRFGLRPLYVAMPTGGGCGAASEVTALLAAPGVDSSWSHTGVSQFFAFGYFFGDDTLMAGVRALPAATCGTYRLADGTYTEQTYWQFRPDTTSRASAADLTRRFEDSFVTAVERRSRVGERLGLSLSGGLDARTILGVMPAGRDLQTVSVGIDGSLDHRSATALARIAGVPHQSFTLDQNFLGQFETHLREMIRLTDGLYLDQGIVMPTMPLYRKLGIQFLMRGHGGELMHMTKAYAFSLDAAALRASEAELEAWLFSHSTNYMLGGVPDDLFTFDVRAGARASLGRALARTHAVDRPVDRVWQLFLNERLHRETPLSLQMFGHFATVRQPYLDNDVIESLFAMPAEMKLADELQTSLLRRVKPAFLDVTNSNTGARMGAGSLETAFAKLRLKVGAKLGLKGYQPYERLGLWLRQDLRPMVEATVTGDRLLASGLFNPDTVRRIVRQHVDGQANHTFLLMSLVIFAMGMEAREQP